MADSSNVRDESKSTATPASTVPREVPRELMEREIMFELMALRDETLLRTLSEEDRRKLGDNPAGRAIYLTVEEAVKFTSSFSNGVGCTGTKVFSNGIGCKWLTIKAPPK